MTNDDNQLKGFRPLLSATIKDDADLKALTYPVYASLKLDGVRVCNHPTLGPVTRTLKSVPNRYVRSILNHGSLTYLDGEVIVGQPTDKGVGNATQSGVMTHDGSPDFTFYAFDCFKNPHLPFKERLKDLHSIVQEYLSTSPSAIRIVQVSQELLLDPVEVEIMEDGAHMDGYEGIMVRSPDAYYKFNRSTLKQQILMKMKRFADAEGTVVGFEPLFENQNDPAKDHLGLQKRSSHQANMVAKETLGAIQVDTAQWGQFNIGSGFDEASRAEIWANKDQYLHKTVTFKYLPYGSKLKPRHPIFLRWRQD